MPFKSHVINLFELRLKINKMVNLAIDILIKRTHVYKQSEILFVRFHRKLNFWAIFAFLQYFTHFGGQKRAKLTG